MTPSFPAAKNTFRRSNDELPGASRFLYDGLPLHVQQLISQSPELGSRNGDLQHAQVNWRSFGRRWRQRGPRRTQVALIIMWMILLWWGEKSASVRSITSCDWQFWERWPQNATPHHVVLLADPQLVDPHTYPGRPWPLSTLTIRHTDLYLRRSFLDLLRILDPDTVFFLGDLFDGGREWDSGSAENKWRKYGKDFWLQEYDRFGHIFLNPWIKREEVSGRHRKERKIIASLPGNHDLGLGNGIRLQVRRRFNTYFGEGNRIDIIGNHTFVSVDTVSLSAKDQPDPATGSQEQGQNHEAGAEIWGAVEEFLSTVKTRKQKALDEELQSQAGKPNDLQYDHRVLEIDDPAALTPQPPTSAASDLSTILLTHVPLYRSPGTPCGPLRERWPPSRRADDPSGPLESDDANAITVAAGHQYQNVLTAAISKELIEKVGNVEHVFSGDDHDYCEVIHRGYTSKGGGVREITVKSMSWAMGVRKPGFLILSLWNPIDEAGKPLSMPQGEPVAGNDRTGSTTVQSHLCLLPDQLAIFIRYGIFLGITLLALMIRAFLVVYGQSGRPNQYNKYPLPLTTSPNKQVEDEQKMASEREASQYGSSSSKWSYQNGLAARASAGRARSTSPGNGYGVPMAEDGSLPTLYDTMDPASNGKTVRAHDRPHRARRKGILDELRWSVLQVASISLLWYAWLVWTIPS